MKLSRTVSYALQATLQLAQAHTDAPVPCSRLATQGKMPERFLLQILRNLVAHGILGSTRGVEGGYTLERTPEEISLLEVIEAIEGPLISAVPVGEGLPEDSRGKLEKALSDVTGIVRRELEAIKLVHLLPRTAQFPEETPRAEGNGHPSDGRFAAYSAIPASDSIH
jgi:Rrf2 family protein